MSSPLIFPRGQLTDADRARLESAGIVAVEADDPGSVVSVVPPVVTGDALLRAAIIAIARSSVAQSEFANQLEIAVRKTAPDPTP